MLHTSLLNYVGVREALVHLLGTRTPSCPRYVEAALHPLLLGKVPLLVPGHRHPAFGSGVCKLLGSEQTEARGHNSKPRLDLHP